jgi:hypothetical protein
VSECGIQEFYEQFFATLESAGVPVVILGGQAMLRYRLAETTKDADLFLRPSHFSGFMTELARCRHRETAPVYRKVISAPLAEPWATAGWSTHFEIPVVPGPRPRLDILARPPRIDPGMLPTRGVAPLFLLAETKKTRREAKDWGQVATLGHFLLDAGDTRGLLLLQDGEELRERLKEYPPDERLIAARPNLRLAWEDSERLGAALETERRFWRMFDAGRWTIFEKASRPYMQAMKSREKEWPATLLEQHEFLCRLARELLPENPLADTGIEALVDQARQQCLLGYPAEFELYLPPKAVVLQPWNPLLNPDA